MGDIRAIMAFALIEPLREGEICRMRRQDIDCSRRTLTIWRSKTDWKTGLHGRVVPLLTPALDVLRQRPARMDGRVWEYTDAHSIGQAFRRVCRKVGITNLRFHDLRHEATSRLFEGHWGRQYQMQEVAVFTGHLDWRSLKRYTHPDPARLAALG